LIFTAAIALLAIASCSDDGYSRITDKVVKDECGACHMAYQPEFLPAESWKAIMSGLADHFGGDATLDASVVRHITDYLVQHAGSEPGHKTARPRLRITRLDWFVKKHAGEVSRRAMKRAGVMSNCTACHRGANEGSYEDD